MASPHMSDVEAIEMMRRASSEIKQQRAEIERLRPKADAYDTLCVVVHNMSRPVSVGFGEDVAWLFDNRIKEIEQTIAAEKAARDALIGGT